MEKSKLQTQQIFDFSSYRHQSLFTDLIYPWEALDQIKDYLQTLPLGEILGCVSNDAFLVNPESIFIDKGTVVEAGAYIQGPCYIGKNCQVRHGAYIRGGVIVGDHCVIGHSTEVKNSIFLNYANAAHLAYIGDSILGNHVNLGAGVKLANLLLSKKNIQVRSELFTINSERRKLGAIIGDNSQLGCNCVTNPGTVLGKNSKVSPLVNVSGVIFENGHVKVDSKSKIQYFEPYAFS